jgi:hypothetical protein
MKAAFHLHLLLLLAGSSLASAESRELQPNMGMRKGIGMGHALLKPHVTARGPRGAIIAGSHAPAQVKTSAPASGKSPRQGHR